MGRKLYFIVIMLFAVIQLQALNPKNNSFIGEWKFNLSDAPYGYEQGTINIREAESNLNGEIKFADGEQIKLEKMKVTEGVLSFQVYAQSGYVNVKAVIEGNKFKGTAMTADGNIPFEAVRVEKK